VPSRKPAKRKRSREEDWSKLKWKRGRQLGRGATGSVYLCIKEADGALFAVKQIPISSSTNKKLVVATSKEIELMKGLHHKNIVRYLGTCTEDGCMNIFLEFISGGSISTLLSYFGAFPEHTISVYVAQILEGLSYLHGHNIIHRDIKGANILVDKTGTVKLTDFGCSYKFATESGCTAVAGTAYWMAAEVFEAAGYGRAVDIWSLGCTIIEMATAHIPWFKYSHLPLPALIGKICTELPPIPQSLSDVPKDFLRLCFQRDPKKRPTSDELLLHSFITQHKLDEEESSMEDSSLEMSAGDVSSLTDSLRDSKNRQIKQIESIVSLDTSLIFKLPREVQLLIFSHLDSPDLVSVSHVCKYWSLLMLEFWQAKCINEWSCEGQQKLLARHMYKSVVNWRDLYKLGNKIKESWQSSEVSCSILKGHTKAIYCVSFMSNSDRIVSGSDDKKLRIWEHTKSKWRCTAVLKGHDQGIYCLSLDGNNDKILLSGSADKTIKIWDTQKGKNIRTIRDTHEWGVFGMQFNSRKGQLVTCSLDGTLKLWDVEKGSLITELAGHTKGIYCCQWSNNMVASGSVDETIKVWDVRDGSCVRLLEGHSDEVTSLCLDNLSPSSSSSFLPLRANHIDPDDSIISGSGDMTVKFWDVGTGRCYNSLSSNLYNNSHSHWIWSVDSYGEYVFSASQDTTVKCWDRKTGCCLKTLKGHKSTIFCLQVKDGRLVSGGKGKSLRVWYLEDCVHKGY